jgi:coenzyme F420-0:L-glutamate ligase/coenzyme F420-1:gamma-L-glutamate ligase
MEQLTLRALHGMPEVAPGADLAALLEGAAEASGVTLRNGVLAVCQKIVSKAEGRMVSLTGIEPREEARKIAAEDGKDARAVELVLRESVRIVRRSQGVLISETAHGFVCAMARMNEVGRNGKVLVAMGPAWAGSGSLSHRHLTFSPPGRGPSTSRLGLASADKPNPG